MGFSTGTFAAQLSACSIIWRRLYSSEPVAFARALMQVIERIDGTVLAETAAIVNAWHLHERAGLRRIPDCPLCS
jgi:hypothetical protein